MTAQTVAAQNVSASDLAGRAKAVFASLTYYCKMGESLESAFIMAHELYVEDQDGPLALLSKVLLEAAAAAYAQGELNKLRTRTNLSQTDVRRMKAYFVLVHEFGQQLGELIGVCRNRLNRGQLTTWLIQAVGLDGKASVNAREWAFSLINGMVAEVFAMDLLRQVQDEDGNPVLTGVAKATPEQDRYEQTDLVSDAAPTGIWRYQVKSRGAGSPVAERVEGRPDLLMIYIDSSAVNGFELVDRYLRGAAGRLAKFLVKQDELV